MKTKICTECKKEKSFSEFHKNELGKYGLMSKCKDCKNALGKKYYKTHIEQFKRTRQKYYINNKEVIDNKNKNWHKNNPEKTKLCHDNYKIKNKEKMDIYTKQYNIVNKDKIKNTKLLRIYGISFSEFNSLKLKQDNKCYICKSNNHTNFNKDLYIDHNHFTKKIRKLLCVDCNFAIGHCQENIDTLNKCILYLNKYNNTKSNYKYNNSWKHNHFEKFQLLLEKCNNQCEICGLEFNNLKKQFKPHIDHDHKTRVIRGILCGHCNSVLGHTKEDPNIIQSIINYLIEHT